MSVMSESSAADLQTFVSRIQLVGRSEGRVKQLRSFDKSRHTVPDQVNAATSAFLARLCASELTEEAEACFQASRTTLQYKRKEISLDVTPPQAVLTARDFTYEIGYELRERAPEEYEVLRTLHQLNDPQLVHRPEFGALFADGFTEVAFVLRKGVQVEAVVDAVEASPDEHGLKVDYPSDCRECTISVVGVAATVRCDGASLAMVFPRAGAPRELLEAFAEVRHAFALSREQALAGLL
jgi:hypothetical protein